MLKVIELFVGPNAVDGCRSRRRDIAVVLIEATSDSSAFSDAGARATGSDN
jgi:hypothetical protein